MSSSVEKLKRVAVVGTTGAGKTTLARELASLLGAAHVELDAYRHGPNWTETPDDIFRERVSEALTGERWVVDGNYSVARDVIWSRATAIVWLDYPFPVSFWRLFRRTMRRGVMRTELWNGNKENLWGHFFTTDSLLLWAVRTHWRRRRSLPEAFALPEYAHLDVTRFRTPPAARRWLDSVAAEVGR